jgi:hypothetical protein
MAAVTKQPALPERLAQCYLGTGIATSDRRHVA